MSTLHILHRAHRFSNSGFGEIEYTLMLDPFGALHSELVRVQPGARVELEPGVWIQVTDCSVTENHDARRIEIKVLGYAIPATPACPSVTIAPVSTYRSAKVYSADDIAELLTALPPLAPADMEAFIQKCRQVAKRVEPAPAPATKRRILLSK